MKDLSNKTTKDLKMKKSKVIKIENGITYLEPDKTNDKPKRIVSAETRKKLSLARRSAKKQPREGQSKKADNFYKQLTADYITFSSARGKFQESKDEEYEHIKEMIAQSEQENIFNNEDDQPKKKKKNQDDENSDDSNKETKNRGTFTPKQKKTSKRWLERKKNKTKLEKIDSKDGIISEYEIQKFLFGELKMEESLLINLEENASNINFFVSNNVPVDLTVESDYDIELELNDFKSQYDYLKSQYDILAVFDYLLYKNITELLAKADIKIHYKQKETYSKWFKKFTFYRKELKLNDLIHYPEDCKKIIDIFTYNILSITKMKQITHKNLINEYIDSEYYNYEHKEIVKRDLMDLNEYYFDSKVLT